MAQKILYILRHAKAEPLTSGQDDHDRPLAERGIREAGAMGKYLMVQQIRPERVLCSSALRTRQTLQHVQDAYPQTMAVHHDEKLYLTSANEMLLVLASMPEEVTRVLLVGHNPGLHELCLRMVKDGDHALRQKLTMKFPTCAFAELQMETSWGEIAKAEAKLARFVTPDSI